MSNISQLLDGIKKKCPDQSNEIDRLKLNIDGYTLFKPINKSDIKASNVAKPKTLKKPAPKPLPNNKFKIGSKVSWKEGRKNLTGNIVNITQKNFIICCKPNSKSNYRINKDLVTLIDTNILPQKSKTLKTSKSSDKKSSIKNKDSLEKDIHAIPFSSIEGCGEINFNEESTKLIKEDSFVKKSKYFDEIETDGDGNCGYHGIIQGLIESYYVLGNKSNDNLKQFIKNIKIKLNLDPKKIASDNRKNDEIIIPREVINHFREFILDIKAPPKLRVPMPDGTLKHVFEREDEVVEYPYDDGKGKYLKKKKSAKDVKKEKINNKKIINRIQGGIKESGIITSDYWLREEVLSGIFFIFNIPIYTFLKYIDTDTGMDRSNNLLPKNCSSVKNCGHIIFMVKNEIHFNYITTNIQGYNNNILKCLGLDKLPTSSKPTSSKSTSTNEDIKKLMDFLKIDKSEAKKILDDADGNLQKAIDNTFKSSSNKSSSKSNKSSLESLKSNKSSSNSNKSSSNSNKSSSKSNKSSLESLKSNKSSSKSNKSSSKSNKSSLESLKSNKSSSKSNKSSSKSNKSSLESLKSNKSSSKSSSDSLNPLTSMLSSIESTSEGDLDDIDYNKNPKLYEQELYKILRKKMPNAKESQIKLKFTEEINKIKSKYKK